MIVVKKVEIHRVKVLFGMSEVDLFHDLEKLWSIVEQECIKLHICVPWGWGKQRKKMEWGRKSKEKEVKKKKRKRGKEKEMERKGNS